MSFQSLIIAAPSSLSTSALVNYLQGLFGPLFLGIVGIVALFFLFTVYSGNHPVRAVPRARRRDRGDLL